MTSPDPHAITAILLAAGRASRMGAPKAALPLAAPWGQPPGEPAAHRVARLCRQAGIPRVIAVLGHHAEVVRPAVADLAIIARNPRPDLPMFSSVQVGLRLALGLASPPEAVLIWPADAPLLAFEALLTLLQTTPEALRGKHHLPWVRVPARQPDLPGHPVLLSRALAAQLLHAPPASRLDHLLAAPGVLRHTVLVEDPYVTLNLNTAADAAPFLHTPEP